MQQRWTQEDWERQYDHRQAVIGDQERKLRQVEDALAEIDRNLALSREPVPPYVHEHTARLRAILNDEDSNDD